MSNDSAIQEVDKILGNKKKFRRALIILFIIAAVLIVGFWTGEISRIISGITRLEKEQQKLLQLLIDGIDDKAVRTRMDENKKIITRLENKHQQMRINKTDFILEVSSVIGKVRNVFNLYNKSDPEEKGKLLRILAKTVHIYNDYIVIGWKMPFNFVLDERILEIANSLPVTAASSDMIHQGSPTGTRSNLRTLIFNEISPAWIAYYIRTA